MKFEVKDRIITGEDCLIVGDNSNYIAEFTFDEEWKGVIKTARFISCNDSYVDVILEKNQCYIPCEVLKCGYCRVGVYSSEMATTKCKFFVTKSVKDETGCVCEPTPDVYSQLLEKIDNIVIDSSIPDYSEIPNKPSINGVELVGNKTTEDLGIVSKETDPTVPSYVKNITESDIANWNNKSEFSGSYNDLTDKPEFPVVPTDISAFNNDIGYLTENDLSAKNYATKSELHSHSNKSVLDNTTASYTISEKTKLAGLSNYNDTALNARVEDVEGLAKGLQQAKSFRDYATLIGVFNSLSNDVYKTGQIINIATTKVPDLWVYDVSEANIPFTYTTDEAIVNLLDTNGMFQVGYYIFGAMETGKVDLEDYIKKTNIIATQLADGSYSITINNEV